MQTRLLGKTGLELPILSFGASSLGQEFRPVSLDEAIRSVAVALDLGLNFIDTSPFYGRGMSEVLLGVALRGVPREQYLLGTKLGRYDANHFDFSARRVAESIDVEFTPAFADPIRVAAIVRNRNGFYYGVEFLRGNAGDVERVTRLEEVLRGMSGAE